MARGEGEAATASGRSLFYGSRRDRNTPGNPGYGQRVLDELRGGELEPQRCLELERALIEAIVYPHPGEVWGSHPDGRPREYTSWAAGLSLDIFRRFAASYTHPPAADQFADKIKGHQMLALREALRRQADFEKLRVRMLAGLRERTAAQLLEALLEKAPTTVSVWFDGRRVPHAGHGTPPAQTQLSETDRIRLARCFATEWHEAFCADPSEALAFERRAIVTRAYEQRTRRSRSSYRAARSRERAARY